MRFYERNFSGYYQIPDAKKGYRINPVRGIVINPNDRFIGWGQKDGYHQITIMKKDGKKTRTTSVHRLNYSFFWGPIDKSKGEIDHMNGDRTDNRLINLRQISHSENMQKVKRDYSRMKDLHKMKSKVWAIEINTDKAVKYNTMRECSKDLDVNVGQVSNIANNVEGYKTAKSKITGKKYRFSLHKPTPMNKFKLRWQSENEYMFEDEEEE